MQGTTKAIQTAVPGIQVSEHFPKLAQQMKKLALVRSLAAETGAHAPGQYLMRTSYKEIASIVGSTRESVTVRLNAMRREGTIAFVKRRILIKRPASLS